MGRKSHLAVNQDPRNPRVYQSKIAEIYGCLYPPVIWYLIGVCTKSRHWKTEPFWKDFQTSLWNSAWKVQQKIQILGFLAPRKCSRTIPLPPNIQTYPSLYNPIGIIMFPSRFPDVPSINFSMFEPPPDLSAIQNSYGSPIRHLARSTSGPDPPEVIALSGKALCICDIKTED
jgi:hypothetical protein